MARRARGCVSCSVERGGGGEEEADEEDEGEANNEGFDEYSRLLDAVCLSCSTVAGIDSSLLSVWPLDSVNSLRSDWSLTSVLLLRSGCACCMAVASAKRWYAGG